MKETAAQYSDPFAKFIEQHLHQLVVKISSPEQDRHSIPWAQQHHPRRWGLLCPCLFIQWKSIQAQSEGCVSLVTAFISLSENCKVWRRQKTVMSYNNEHRCEAIFTRFYNENVKHSETWKENSLTHGLNSLCSVSSVPITLRAQSHWNPVFSSHCQCRRRICTLDLPTHDFLSSAFFAHCFLSVLTDRRISKL